MALLYRVSILELEKGVCFYCRSFFASVLSVNESLALLLIAICENFKAKIYTLITLASWHLFTSMRIRSLSICHTRDVLYNFHANLIQNFSANRNEIFNPRRMKKASKCQDIFVYVTIFYNLFELL